MLRGYMAGGALVEQRATDLHQVWSDRRDWGFKTSSLVVAAVNRIHPENSVVRCMACLSSVVTLERQPNSPRCASTACRFNRVPNPLKRSTVEISCPLHRTMT